jgi:hypothetical protein
MQPYFAELVGVAAACATLYAAHAKTIIPLRMAALAGNFLAMVYSLSHGTYPTFLLNAALLPLNAVRLHAMRKLIRDVDAAIKGDMNVDWLLPYTRPRRFKAGDIMMARGEYAVAAAAPAVTTAERVLVQCDACRRSDGRGNRAQVGPQLVGQGRISLSRLWQRHFPPGTGFDTDVRLPDHVFRLGINYKFGEPWWRGIDRTIGGKLPLFAADDRAPVTPSGQERAAPRSGFFLCLLRRLVKRARRHRPRTGFAVRCR